MPPREEFSTKGLEGTLSNDIGWHFGTPLPNTKGNVVCKLCGKVVKGGITRFKEHIAHKTGNVAPCPNVTGKQLEKVSNHNTSGIEGKNSVEVLVVGITFMKKGGLLMDQLENIIEKEQVNQSQEDRGAVSKFLIYERLPFQLASSPWLYNLIQVSTEVEQGVKFLTPYEVLDVYWSQSINEFVIGKGTIFLKSVDVSSVRNRDVEFYYSLLDSVVEEIGENYIVQVVTNNEVAMKATGKKLMLKRKHLYWTSCAAHCLDLCLEGIEKKLSVAKVLNEAKKVT
ncbi:hypothetical protein CXB51_034749 [Gossypium anomalum]|uniref:BED-type domain-containing protein n=1 Tax=Gossypium anomalum TaxID=47600 RepID=A0A8J6CM11_9ROSI|nr:hypothetical protein CXB51_034749 [Gossypium anomalum]